MALQARFDAMRARHFPPGLNRVPAHVSLFHTLPGEALAALTEQVGRMMPTLPDAATIDGIRRLGRGVAFTVDSPGLQRLRAGLATSFADHLTAQDRQPFRPHVTVQNKADPASARALADGLAAGFAPIPTVIAAIAVWYYDHGDWLAAATLPWG